MKKITIVLALFAFTFLSILKAQQTDCSFDYYIGFGNYGSDEICPGSSVDFYGYYQDAESYFWDFQNGITSAQKYPYNIVFNNVGVYNYTLTITNSCGNDTTVTGIITVRDDIDFNKDSRVYVDIEPHEVCPGEDIRFDTWGDDVKIATWDIGEGSPVVDDYFRHTYAGTGSFPVELTVENGCGYDTIIYDTVLVDPNIQFNEETYINYDIREREVCPGEEINFDAWGDFETATWDLGDGATRQDNYFNYTYAGTGDYPVVLTLTNACGDDTTITDLVSIKDDLRYSGQINIHINPDEVCPGDKANFETGEDAVKYEWSLSDGYTSELDEFKHEFDVSGLYDVTLTLTNGCGNDTTVTKQITVRDDIVFGTVDFYISPKETCPNQDVRFSASEFSNTYIWTFGDGNVSSSKRTYHSFSGEQDKYPVSLTVANGCGNSKTVTDTVKINNNIAVTDVDFMVQPTEACPGQEIIFMVEPDEANQISWNFGDGAVSDEMLEFHSYDLLGNFNATLQVTNGCGRDTIVSQKISIQDDIEPSLKDYEYDILIEEACIGDTVAFLLLPASQNLDVTWYFGDGASLSDPELLEVQVYGFTYKILVFKHVYNANGTYKSVLSLTNGCGKTITDTIPITISSNAELGSLDMDINDNQIEINKPIQFMAQGGIVNVFDYGDGTIDTIVGSFIFTEHTYTQGGVYNVTLTSENNCGKSKTVEETITIYDQSENVSTVEADICEGNVYSYGGTDYSETGIHDFVYGPDSIVILDIEVHPHWNVEADTFFCQGSAINIDGTWYSTPGATAVANLTSSFGCDSTVTYTLKNDTSAYKEQICIVTIDLETGKNLVTWEKTPGRKTTGYSVWRESNTQGVYDSIVYLPFDSLSVFVDIGSEPEQQQELYKLMSYDVCGNETNLNDIPYHKTLFLQYVGSIGGVNLSWKLYEIDGVSQTFNSYIIFRGTSPTNLAPIDTVSGSLNAYTDDRPDALSDLKYYRVAGVKAVECDPNGKLKANAGPFSRSLSNLEDNRQQGSNVSEQSLSDKISMSIYPNPYGDYTNIHYRLNQAGNVRIAVLDMAGRKLETIANDHQPEGEYKFRFSAKEMGYGPGMFLLNVEIDGQRMVKTLVEMDE